MGDARPGDMVWLLYGADNLFVFRRKEQYHELVGEVLDVDGVLADVPALIAKAVKMREANSFAVQTISIY